MKSKVLVWLAAALVGMAGFAFNTNAASDYELLEDIPVKRSRRMLYNERRGVYVVLRNSGRRARRDSLGDISLHNAVRLGHREAVIELLREPDINVNARNKNGNTALHVAVENRRWGIITYLVRHADNLRLNLRNRYGQTPLDIARANGTEAYFRSCFPANIVNTLR